MPAQQGAGVGQRPIATAPSDADRPARPDLQSRGESPGVLQAGQVRAMFDRIAGVYDLMNTAMTAGLHHRWRERAAAYPAEPGETGRKYWVVNENFTVFPRKAEGPPPMNFPTDEELKNFYSKVQ